MRRKPEIWIIVILELLFAACALSVLLYRYLGIAFDFAWLSYRVFNISISLGLIAYLTYALLKHKRHALVIAFLFSLFHFIEGIFINFYAKTIIHGIILAVIVIFYYRYNTIFLKRTGAA